MQVAAIAVLGRYEVLSHLATGGMAEVYLARTSGVQGFARHVVIKKIRAEFVKDPRFVRMFLDEARLAATLHHHNVVQVYDVGQEAGEYFFAMEYVHGEDLRRILGAVSKRKERLKLDYALTIVQGAASGLNYAHNRCNTDGHPLNIVHRDVSPSNVLVGYDGGVKLVDFGIAKATTGPGETQTGTLKGKISYLSPEQIRGGPLDRRSDVFSLGIVLFELTTTRKLFRAKTDFETMRKIVAGEVPRPSKVVPGYPPELEKIVLRALTVDPAARYANAAELLQDLEQFATEQRLTLSPIALGRWITELFGGRPEPWNNTAPPAPPANSDDAWTMLDGEMQVAADVAVVAAGPAPARTSAPMPAELPRAQTEQTQMVSNQSRRSVGLLVDRDADASFDDMPKLEPVPRPIGKSQQRLGVTPVAGPRSVQSSVRAGARSRRNRQQTIMLVAIVLTGIALVIGALFLRTRAPKRQPPENAAPIEGSGKPAPPRTTPR